jgi:hypothetical protein
VGVFGCSTSVLREEFGERDEVGIELAASDPGELGQGLGAGENRAVATTTADRVVDVDDGEETGREGDSQADKTEGIALAVPALMVMGDGVVGEER